MRQKPPTEGAFFIVLHQALPKRCDQSQCSALSEPALRRVQQPAASLRQSPLLRPYFFEVPASSTAHSRIHPAGADLRGGPRHPLPPADDSRRGATLRCHQIVEPHLPGPLTLCGRNIPSRPPPVHSGHGSHQPGAMPLSGAGTGGRLPRRHGAWVPMHRETQWKRHGAGEQLPPAGRVASDPRSRP